MYIFFVSDFDGTLFDTYPGMVHAFKVALKEHNIDVSESEIHKYMSISVKTAINHFKENHKLNDDFIYKFIEYEKKLEGDKVIPFPFAKEICLDFKKSGGKNYILTHRGNSTLKFLEHHGMTEYFEEIATKHNKFKRKPDPEGFSYFTKKYGMSNHMVLGVGDRECDILGAKEAGINTCLYNTNNIELNENVDYRISSLEELYKILSLK